RNRPDWTVDSATDPSGLTTLTEVRKTTTARGIRMTTIVLNWRLRYASAPSWIDLAISIIFGVPWSAARTPLARKKPTAIASSAVTPEKSRTSLSPEPRWNDWYPPSEAR